MSDGVMLLIGVLLAAGGGELFVRGAVGLATNLRVPPGIVGATVAAFATSTPEFSVGVNAALSGEPGIALGDALGSNVVNIAVVLGLAVVLVPMRPGLPDIRRDLPFALGAPLLTMVLVADGTLGRVDAVVALMFFGTWLTIAVLQARRARTATAEVLGERGLRTASLLMAGGVALLIVSGWLVVTAAEGIGEWLEIDAFIVGATLVAFATSTPELATIVIARLRGHSEIAMGTLVGSNIFNNLCIVGVAALISPIAVDRSDVVFAASAGAAVLLLAIPRGGVVGRRDGLLLLAAYGVYVTALAFTG